MIRSSSTLGFHLAAALGGALVALGCGSTDPTRAASSVSSTEHASIDSATAGDVSSSRVVGYLPIYRSLDPSTVDLDALTHLTLAFAKPLTAAAGSPIDFEIGDPESDSVRAARALEIAKLVSAAHDKHVKVLGSLGGGDKGGQQVADSLALDSDAFVTSTLAFLDRYALDGIDIDIEGPAIDPVTYGKLVDGLAARLPEGKLLTAAVSNNLRENYRALDKAAFISVMSYDQCGSWTDSCPHSTYEQAQLDLDFWSTEYWQTAGGHYDPANVVLGVPFFGYCWGTGCSKIAPTVADRAPVTYQQVLSFWNNLQPGNPAPVPDLITDAAAPYYISLNGPQTIQRKATLAKHYGGITIWELGQDATGPSSLISAIESAR